MIFILYNLKNNRRKNIKYKEHIIDRKKNMKE